MAASKTKILGGVAAVTVVLVAALFFLLPDSTAPEFVDTDDEIGQVRRFVPTVTVTNVSTDSTMHVGRSLMSGDTLRTNQSGYAMVLFLDESLARVSPSSQMVIRSVLNDNKDMNIRTQISLALGALFMDVRPRPDTEFEITTSQTVASVKGTKFGMNSDNFIWVEEGEVEVTVVETGEAVTLLDRMFVQVEEDGSYESGELTAEELEELSANYQILDSDLIEREMRLQFRNRNGDVMDEDLRIFEQEQENGGDQD